MARVLPGLAQWPLAAPSVVHAGANKKGLVVKPDSVLGFKSQLCLFQLRG